MAEKEKIKQSKSYVLPVYPFGFAHNAQFYRMPFFPGSWGPRHALAAPLYGPWGIPFSAETARKNQINALKVQAEHLENMARDIREYIAEIEKKSEKKK
jgi:hypothetical protein